MTPAKKIEMVELYTVDGYSFQRIADFAGCNTAMVKKVLYDSGVRNGEKRFSARECEILAKASIIKSKFRKESLRKAVGARLRRMSNLPPIGDRFKLYNCPLVDAPIEPESIDVIVTDPPYLGTTLDSYIDLAHMGEKWLKPNGQLFCLAANFSLPTIIRYVLKNSKLKYNWTMCCCYGSSQTGYLITKNLKMGWKPLLWFQKGKRLTKHMMKDIFYVDGNDDKQAKELHMWGQSVSLFSDIVRTVTEPADVVCDPFVGSGTTGVAALKMNRQFIGIDISKRCIEVTKSRLWSIANSKNGSH